MTPPRAPFAPPPAWRLPAGVDPALWAYAGLERLADDETDYFAGHPLVEADLRWLRGRLAESCDVVDLGCGTGRAALALATKRRRVAAVDLSLPMLRKLEQAAARTEQPVCCVRANLCAPLGFPSASFDAALMLFSTLGMIRGRPARRRALIEARRIVRPGGRLFLHVHNLANNLRDPQGRRWLLGQAVAIIARRPGAGDRAMTYRGIPNVVVHQYRWRELTQDLRFSDWGIAHSQAIDAATARPIEAPWLLPAWRAGGWLLECRALA
jgi:SAM-dependent methyltransferase